MPATSRFGGVPVEDEAPKQGGSRFGGVPVDDAAPAAKPPESRGFLREAWDEIKKGPANLAAAGTALQGSVLGALVNPVAQAKSGLNALGTPIRETGTAAVDAAKRGDAPGTARAAVNTGINMVLPGTGSSSQEAGDMLNRGDVSGGLGKTAGIGVNVGLGIVGPKVAKAAAEAIPSYTVPKSVPGANLLSKETPSSLKAFTRADPRVAVNRGLAPTPSDPGFPKRIPETLKSIKFSNKGKTPGGITAGEMDLIPATQKAIEEHQAALDQYMTRAKGVQVPGDPIVEATRQAIPKLVWTESPATAQALVDDAQRAFGGKMFPVEDFRDFLRTGNASKFFGQKPGAQQSAALAGAPPAIEAAKTKAIRNVLYPALDPEGNGAGPRLIQQKTGDLIDVREAALRRNNAIVAQQPLSPLGKMLEPITGPLKSLLPGKAHVGINFAQGDEAATGRSLPLLKRAFEAVGDAQPNVLPKPGSPLYPGGNPQRQLPAPGPVTPPPMDPSFARSAPGMGQPLNPRRALPPGPDMITPPPPDASSVRVAPGMQAPPRPDRALSPASSIQVPPSPIGARAATIPSRTGVPGDDSSFVRSVPGEYPQTPLDKVAIEKFSKPFRALTPEQQGSISGGAKMFAKGGIAGKNGPEKIIVGDGGEAEVIVPLSHIRRMGPQAQKHLLNGIGSHLGIGKQRKSTLGEKVAYSRNK